MCDFDGEREHWRDSAARIGVRCAQIQRYSAISMNKTTTRASRGLAACGHLVLIVAMLTCARTLASDRFEPRLYDLVVTTQMPHLDENLRYTKTREKRCLGREDFTSAFPILRHPALQGCTLRNETRDADDNLVYELTCEGKQASTGIAAWHLTNSGIVGVLSVKMGGKNLTFGQRIDGTPIGGCTT